MSRAEFLDRAFLTYLQIRGGSDPQEAANLANAALEVRDTMHASHGFPLEQPEPQEQEQPRGELGTSPPLAPPSALDEV